MDGSSGLDGDVSFFDMELFAKFTQLLKNHGFSAGDHNVGGCPFGGCIDNCIHIPGVPLGFPGGVSGVAEPASEVASAGSNEDAGGACQFALTLDAVENFRDPDHAGLNFASLEQSICRPDGKMHC